MALLFLIQHSRGY